MEKDFINVSDNSNLIYQIFDCKDNIKCFKKLNIDDLDQYLVSDYSNWTILLALIGESGWSKEDTNYIDKNNFQNTIDYLIENGVDVNKPSRCEFIRSPLALAMDDAVPEVFEILINGGADVNYVNYRDESLLMSSKKQSYEYVKLLLENDANYKFINNDGDFFLNNIDDIRYLDKYMDWIDDLKKDFPDVYKWVMKKNKK